TFDGEPDLEILSGRYGPYITYNGANYRIPKNLHERAAELTIDECMTLIHEQQEKESGDKPATRRRFYTKKKQ
ncbi:MAG: hypothetical protein II746_10195, partial [Bacteroidaceae bacterium]|nr:hypothetical protein [Bacteroidaceae bacterium]